jgi:ParB-like chromosome segregation protein Spo0J
LNLPAARGRPINVERWPIERLIPYAKNSRTHSDAQVAQIAASMREWGWTNPVLADEAGGVIAGHARILAARQLGIADVPVMVARGWSDAQKRAYVLADNKLALNAGWDDELLRFELGELKLGGFDLSLTGFGEAEQAAILNKTEGLTDPDDAEQAAILNKTEGLTDPDDAPAAPEYPVSLTGDLWLRAASDALWRQHGCDRRRASSRRGQAAPNGDRSAVGRQL